MTPTPPSSREFSSKQPRKQPRWPRWTSWTSGSSTPARATSTSRTWSARTAAWPATPTPRPASAWTPSTTAGSARELASLNRYCLVYTHTSSRKKSASNLTVVRQVFLRLSLLKEATFSVIRYIRVRPVLSDVMHESKRRLDSCFRIFTSDLPRSMIFDVLRQIWQFHTATTRYFQLRLQTGSWSIE